MPAAFSINQDPFPATPTNEGQNVRLPRSHEKLASSEMRATKPFVATKGVGILRNTYNLHPRCKNKTPGHPYHLADKALHSNNRLSK